MWLIGHPGLKTEENVLGNRTLGLYCAPIQANATMVQTEEETMLFPGLLV